MNKSDIFLGVGGWSKVCHFFKMFFQSLFANFLAQYYCRFLSISDMDNNFVMAF